MPKLDERLTRALERSTRTEPAGPEVFDDVVRRRGRRERSRRVQRGALVVAVVAITLGGSLAIRDWVGDNAVPAGQQTNGRILFVRSQSQLHPGGGSSASEFQIWSIDSAGDDLAQLPVGDEGLFAATWSPDGRRIAYLARNENPVDALRPLDLWVVNADGGEPVRWVEGVPTPLRPTLDWSPDGTEVAVLGTRRDGLDTLDRFGLPLLDIQLAGPQASRYVERDGSVMTFDLARDGTVAAVVRDSSDDDASPSRARLVAFAPDDVGTKLERTLARKVSWTFAPSWSPTSDHVLFARSGSSGDLTTELYIVDAEGEQERKLVDEEGVVSAVAWAPDGSRILYTRQTRKVCQIVSVAPDGSDRRVVADRQDLGGCAGTLSWQVLATPESTSSTGAPTPVAAVTDIGLDFRLCDVQRLGGIDFFGDGSRGVAWTGSPVKQSGRCSTAYDAAHVVAVDLDGDGSADSFAELPICTACEPHDATDLGGDGTKELVVLLQSGSTPQYGLFDVVPDGLPRSAGIYPLSVDPPGARRADLAPGEPITLWAGGDEGFSAAIRCEGYPEAPELVLAWSLYAVADAESDPNATEEFHLTRLQLDEPGPEAASFVVVDTTTTDRPRGEPLPFETPPRTCGVDWAL